MYLKKGYNPAEFKSNPMSKRIWYHKALKLMMIQYLNVEETGTEDQTEEKNPEDNTKEDQDENEEEHNTKEPPPPKEPLIEEPPQQEPPTTEDTPVHHLTNELMDHINFLMTTGPMKTLSAELPDLGYISDILLPPLHTKNNQEAPDQAEIEAIIEQELEDFECQQQEKTMKEVKKNYNKMTKTRKHSLIERIGWKTKYIK
jgi:hypothetical protein